MQKTFKIVLKGCVQGVGFRPLIFKLAKKSKIKGYVSNNEEGVFIIMNATINSTEEFLNLILKKKPKNSIINEFSISELEQEEFKDFEIRKSIHQNQINIPLTPDFAICNECEKDIFDSENRRYQYAFTTCTNCGPRFSITEEFPFDRKNTSLNKFKMCKTCLSEYEHPLNRRFHSQTNSCPKCGILLTLENKEGKKVDLGQTEIISEVVKQIKLGRIIAIKSTNGFLFCCDASQTEAIETLRIRKNRKEKPFAVLYPSMKMVKENFHCNKAEKKALKSTIAPIVILKNRKSLNIIKNQVAPELNYTGVILAQSALLKLIIKKANTPLIATSGNISGSPIYSDSNPKLKEIADFILDNNLEIEFPQDDSLVKLSGKKSVILRRSRGMAPNILINNSVGKEKILAMGSDLKSTFSFIPNSYVYTSQYFGNLENFEVLNRYQKTISKFLKLFRVNPETILVDSHPNYQSSILGKEMAIENAINIYEIQHHKAHFASVLAENNLFDSKEPILGVIWDGTGYGEDNTIWGGEFFLYSNKEMKRVNHFQNFDWIANNKMSFEPRLSLLSLLPKEKRHSIKNKFDTTEWEIYTKLLENNKLKTSSVGRLFDAVASYLSLCDFNQYESKASLLLEQKADEYKGNKPIDFLYGMKYSKLPSENIIMRVIEAKEKGISNKKIAASFIYTLANIIINEALKQNCKIIACSGGVFQNVKLRFYLNQLAESKKIILKNNCILSPNDENISFGQLMYYQNLIKCV